MWIHGEFQCRWILQNTRSNPWQGRSYQECCCGVFIFHRNPDFSSFTVNRLVLHWKSSTWAWLLRDFVSENKIPKAFSVLEFHDFGFLHLYLIPQSITRKIGFNSYIMYFTICISLHIGIIHLLFLLYLLLYTNLLCTLFLHHTLFFPTHLKNPFMMLRKKIKLI